MERSTSARASNDFKKKPNSNGSVSKPDSGEKRKTGRKSTLGQLPKKGEAEHTRDACGNSARSAKKARQESLSKEPFAGTGQGLRPAVDKEEVRPQFSPSSPLLNQGPCKCEEHARPSSSDEDKKSFHLTPCKTPREVLVVDDDSLDSAAESEVEQESESLQRSGARRVSCSPGSRKFVVVSSDDDSIDEKMAEPMDTPKESNTELLLHRRSPRLLNLSSKPETNSSQAQPRRSTRKDGKAERATPSKKSKRGDSAGEKKSRESKSGDTSEEELPSRVMERRTRKADQKMGASSEQERVSSDPASGTSDCIEDPPQTSDPAKKVKDTLRLFNSYYLRFVQDEEGRCQKEAIEVNSKRGAKTTKHSKNDVDEERRKSRRPDLKAITQMKLDNTILYKEKFLGHAPGINVGDQFFSRCELTAIGLHGHWLAGIDYAGGIYKRKMPKHTLPVATSLVLSGLYEDDVDNSEDVIYTGQGGNDLLGNKRQIADQTMERGNLALKNSMEQNLPVRLVRGHKTKKSYTGKVYTYDGLYKVTDFWAEKGISGFTVFKFRLHRIEGQPVLTTDQVHFCAGQVPSSPAELRGVVSPDISGGLERISVPASNVVDNPPFAPQGFKYMIKNEVQRGVSKPLIANGCNCKGECGDATKCSCAILNGMKFPYVTKNGGRLVEPMDVVYECGPQCGCGPSCSNRVSQRGLHYRLEVFRTANKGWGVRSWDTIPAGAPVCEYTGLLMKTEDADDINGNDYIFELDCLQTMKGIGARQRRLLSKVKDVNDTFDGAEGIVAEQPEYCINAGSSGNVSRFINHSCEPNLFVQCVLNTHHDLSQPRIFLFASDNIHPLQELTYDYGYELDSVVIDGKVKRVACYCGAHGCRKRLY